MWTLLQSVVVKQGGESKAVSLPVPGLTCTHELWVVKK